MKARLRWLSATVHVRVLASDWGEARARAEKTILEGFAPDALESVSSWEVEPEAEGGGPGGRIGHEA